MDDTAKSPNSQNTSILYDVPIEYSSQPVDKKVAKPKRKINTDSPRFSPNVVVVVNNSNVLPAQQYSMKENWHPRARDTREVTNDHLDNGKGKNIMDEAIKPQDASFYGMSGVHKRSACVLRDITNVNQETVQQVPSEKRKLLHDAFNTRRVVRTQSSWILSDVSNGEKQAIEKGKGIIIEHGTSHEDAFHGIHGFQTPLSCVTSDILNDTNRHSYDPKSGTYDIPVNSLNSFYETTRRHGKRISRSKKRIQSVARGLSMDNTPTILEDEDSQTLRDVTSDSGDSEYVSNDDNSDDSADYEDYDDLGDQSYECQSCGAMMWYAERLDKHRNTSRPEFSLCCQKDKVQLPYMKNAPPTLSNLLFGQNYHMLGSMLPEEGARPKFAQLYIFDTENEVRNRIDVVRSGNGSNNLDTQIVASLKDMIDENNVLAQSYRAARDRFSREGLQGVKLKLVKSRSTNGRTYNLPNASEIAALIVGDFDTQEGVRDIVVETQSKKLQRISELHPLYLPFQYPLIFPYGEDGYREDIDLRESFRGNSGKRKNLTMREYFAYRFQKRSIDSPVLLNSKKLFQQLGVDAYSMIESQRLNFIRHNQDQLRVDMYKGIEERFFKGDTEGKSVGKRIILPGSFIPGPRYMFNNFVDALQICNWIGFPSLFITITCNPQWPEIQRVLNDTSLRPEDRPDILCRVFKMKLDSLMTDFKNGHIFGRIRAHVCTIEFQKRGLPHAHILLWLDNDAKPKCSADIDTMICAEIPDKKTDRKMYNLVEKYMIHGPCGHANLNSPCMKDGVCTKRFPKKFVQRTEADPDGYPVYRRRDDGRTVRKKNTILDNGFVVPYNRVLLSKYRAHINIELCNQSKSIKYLFKYVNKGDDRVTATFFQPPSTDADPAVRDEIKMYYDCRYLSACEAMWRIFAFEIHYRDPPVIRLSFHLPDNQPLVFNENQSLKRVLERTTARQTMFLAWFEANKTYPPARELRYAEFPQHYVYKDDSRVWVPRKKRFAIGRVTNVPPTKGEDFYLRLLLNVQRGCKSYEDIRRLSRPEHVWEKCWSNLSDDITYKHQKRHNNPDLTLSDDSLKNYALIEIEKILQSNGKSLRNFDSMPMPLDSSMDDTENRLVLDELDYDVFAMTEELKRYLSSITDEQRRVYDAIMDAVSKNCGGMYFLYGHGGTGKTFIWRTLSAAVRSKGEIVLNVASSGIASLLLPGGRTAHSRFGLPIIVHDGSTCNITQQSPQAELLIKARLIIWDEAPMMHRYCFEALDKTLRSITHVPKPFGGKVVVLGGDFRQILPVVLKASRQDIVHATINSSQLWEECKVLKLHTNMRLQSSSNTSEVEEVKEFADWILSIGNGEAGEQNDGEASVEIPEDMLIPDSEDPLLELLQFVYPDLLSNISNPDYFQGRAVLAPTNDCVEFVNEYLCSLFPGEEKLYLSADSMCKDEMSSEENAQIYTTEFLNTVSCSGLPSHRLKLKENVPVMLIRNIDQARGLCNGTRLQVVRMGTHVLSCKVLSGKNTGDVVFIPRMTLVPSNSTLPIKFQRRQFPLMISFAMTINKS
ncbi:PREDICTED: uncharacterized protein LOC105954317 [Erythranthe guttata]|uniref:uncharacterized protein LOC105954317 n=1 Tax=Erythranthe guttata TaxID=4155 RepID=UPI00064DB8EA|nr:PREDICTED: uncharacterized protein LOC105954317 [Erythranthe guttata]|eukprot:XP_012833445.1 PREDICTED: uncharacterized protein LOC105954317 [Erythranthe guttata]